MRCTRSHVRLYVLGEVGNVIRCCPESGKTSEAYLLCTEAVEVSRVNAYKCNECFLHIHLGPLGSGNC